ncbi:MAG: YbaB/EbfC family nucleoid-associated protein [Candidatus Kerfeldbacteria bacterium]|nr:YbaB/EbfC family nucleoid-associated protein [Candidatus Kerfeldbacteria bacterium]
MFNKIKELKHLRDQAHQIKTMLSQETVHTDAAHGTVQLVMDGNQEVLSIDINPSLLAPTEKEKLETAIREATNDAIKKAQRIMAEKLRGMGGLNMPGM